MKMKFFKNVILSLFAAVFAVCLMGCSGTISAGAQEGGHSGTLQIGDYEV